MNSHTSIHISSLFLVRVSYLFRGIYTRSRDFVSENQVLLYSFLSLSFSLFDNRLILSHTIVNVGRASMRADPPKNTRRPYSYRRGPADIFFPNTRLRARKRREGWPETTGSGYSGSLNRFLRPASDGLTRRCHGRFSGPKRPKNRRRRRPEK